jgi:hypothetical protein
MPMTQNSRAPARKLALIAGSIALAMIVGGTGWYLGHKNHAPPAESSGSAQAERQLAIVPTGNEVASKQPEATATQPHGKAVKNPAMLSAEDVANPAQAQQEVRANEAYAATNSETPGLASKPVAGARG